MMQRGGYFSRTPKHGTTATAKSDRAPRLPLAEALLALFFLGALVAFLKAGLFIGIPFLLLFLSGYGYVAVAGIRERFVDA